MAHCHACVNPKFMAHSPMATRSPQAQDKYILRLPSGMRDRLKSEAHDNGRSLNAEMVQRLSVSLEADEEGERLWEELHKRDAKIRQIEELAYDREKHLTGILEEYKAIVTQRDFLLKAVCYQVLMHHDKFPEETRLLAESLLKDDIDPPLQEHEMQTLPESRHYHAVSQAKQMAEKVKTSRAKRHEMQTKATG